MTTPGVGTSERFQTVVRQADDVAPIPRPVLIRGERGTGKELLAHYIHDRSPRTDGPYLIVNCGAFQDELILSHLFGHEKGSFTGATEQRIGIFERAHGGSLFLDEIANLSLSAQARLHRAVEYQSFQRVGGSAPVQVDVRIIAATNADLARLIDEGRFMADLYDRLRFAELTLPPLRDRRADIPGLIDHFIARLHDEMPDLGGARITEAAMERLVAYNWPGNVRELKNVVERLYLCDRDRVIQASELPIEITAARPADSSFKARVEAFEKTLLLNALRDSGGNQRGAADTLGLSYDQFRHHYKKYALGDLLN